MKGRKERVITRPPTEKEKRLVALLKSQGYEGESLVDAMYAWPVDRRSQPVLERRQQQGGRRA